MGFAVSILNLILASTISLLAFGLGIIVFLKNKGSWINRSFGIFSLGATIWILSAYLSDLPQLSSFSLYFNRLIFAGLSLMLAGFFHFCFLFPSEKKPSKFFLNFIYSIGTILVFLSFFTPFIIKGIVFKEWGTDLITGPLFPFFIGFSFICSLGVVKIFLEYRKAASLQKIQIQYLFLGLFLFTLINIFIHIFLPGIRGGREFYQIGNYSTLFLIGFTAYAIVTRQLFDIRVILTEILVGVIAIILFIQMMVAGPLWLKILNGVVFILFCLFGYFLIKTTIKEIEMRKEVEKLSQAKSEFISIASHQLRTPLTAIKGYISMVLEKSYGKPPEKMEKPLENIYASNERLIKLVNDLLNLSRLEAGKIEFNPELTSLKELVSGIIQELRINVEKKGLYIKIVKPSEPLPKIMLDRDKIRQVILNIIDNAIKYTKEGGITVNLEKLNSEEQIKVSDTGEGMDEKEIQSLFQIFSRATAGTQLHTEGAGIGLYVARQFVEMHGGKIWAESLGKGKGSTFIVRLPIQLSPKLLKSKTRTIINK